MRGEEERKGNGERRKKKERGGKGCEVRRKEGG